MSIRIYLIQVEDEKNVSTIMVEEHDSNNFVAYGATWGKEHDLPYPIGKETMSCKNKLLKKIASTVMMRYGNKFNVYSASGKENTKNAIYSFKELNKAFSCNATFREMWLCPILQNTLLYQRSVHSIIEKEYKAS